MNLWNVSIVKDTYHALIAFSKYNSTYPSLHNSASNKCVNIDKMPRKSSKSRAKSMSVQNRRSERAQPAPQADSTNSNKLHIDNVIRGNFHQGDERFSSNTLGRQCLAMLLHTYSIWKL